jgi:DNA-binding GntR family transcriptional regulator
MSETGGRDPDAPLTATPRRVLLADDSYRILREALIANRLPPGQRLNIEQLAEEMQVSITPIRHALVRLESDGLVSREPYKGYVVSHLLDPSTVADIFDARLLIETQVAARAAEQASKEVGDALIALADEDPMASVDDPAALGVEAEAPMNNDGALHLRIAQIAGNPVLVDTLDSLAKRMSAYRSFRTELFRTKWSPRGEFLVATKNEHAAIARAIRRGNAEAARTAMRKDLENARRRDMDAAPE